MLKAGKWTYSEKELDRMFAEATKRGEESLKTEIQAHAARYDRKTNRLIIDLKNGATHIVPCELIQGLRDADPRDIAAVELGLRGASLHWEKLDQDFTVGGLVRGIFGTKKWMEQLYRRSRSKTKAKDAMPANSTARGNKTAVTRRAAASTTSTNIKRGRKAA